MARVCLPRKERDDLIIALRKGEISLSQLTQMTSKERGALFAKRLPIEQAKLVNATFEQALISNQKKALKDWVVSTTKAKDPIRKDMLKRVDRIERALTPTEQGDFLQDLAETKLGIRVTEEEAKQILIRKKLVDDAKSKIDPNEPRGSENRMRYGYALDDFKTYVANLKNDAEALTFKERAQLSNWGKNIIDAAGAAKSLVATFDNSFIGRQGIKTLLTGNYKQWFKSFKGSFELLGKELVAKTPGLFKDRDDAIMRTLRAEIYSRPNSLNGKYTAAKNGYGLGVLTEEAYPSSLPEKLPFIGRLFKASNTAFSGSALRMRADLADAMIARMEDVGVDMLDETQATAFGKIVGSMTGRGHLGRGESVATNLNALFFSPRFLKANFDTLTAHAFDKTFTPEAKREAAKNLLKIVGSLGVTLSVLKMVNPDGVELDPRSSRFGKIRVNDKWVDITGGMGGLVTLAMRGVPTLHNGEWGQWTKSATSQKFTKLGGGDFGDPNYLDTFEQFFEGKLSPLAGAVRDLWKGETYSGDKPTVPVLARNLVVPISLQNLVDDIQKGNDQILFSAISDGLGFSVSDSVMFGTSEKWDKLEQKKGEAVKQEALVKLTENYNKRVGKLKDSRRWDKMDNEEQSKELDKIKREETDKILSRYGVN